MGALVASVFSIYEELEDHSTARLMTNFYANLKTKSKPLQALQDATNRATQGGLWPLLLEQALSGSWVNPTAFFLEDRTLLQPHTLRRGATASSGGQVSQPL